MYDGQIIADNIRILRTRKGYTQEELAEAAGISASHLGKIERGQRQIGMKTYLSILDVLKVGDEEYAALACGGEADEDWSRYKTILSDCTKTEKKFLLDTMEMIKSNMRKMNLTVITASASA